MRMIRLWIAAIIALCSANMAHAACSLAPTSIANLATSSSYAVRTGGIAKVATAPSLTCNGSIASVLSTDHARVSASSANSFRLKAPSGETIAYRLSADSAGNYALNQGGTINYLDPALVSLLGILSTSAFTPPMYVALSEMPNIPAGTYTDTVVLAWSWHICRGIGALGLCILSDQGTGTTTLQITLVVTNDCRISAPDISFGMASLPRDFTPVNQAVGVDCTKGTAFAIAFTGGNSGVSRPWRTMSDGAGHLLEYNLYRSDGVTIWDESNPLTQAGIGTGALTPALMHPYVARINPDQTAQPAGSYSDRISIIVTF